MDVALAAVATAYAVVALARAPAWTVDDAFIVARYADNLAHTGRLAFNLEGPPVEGFSSLLAVLVGAAASAAGLPTVGALRALGVLAFVSTGLLLLALAKELRVPPPAGGAAAALNATVAENVTHATSALETELYVALSVALAWAAARALRTPRRPSTPLAALAFALCLCRPEGVIAAALLTGVVLARRRRQGPSALRPAVRAVAQNFVLPMALVVLARGLYYRDFVPNTFRAKLGGWNLSQLRDLGGLFDACTRSAILVALVLAAVCGLLEVPVRGPGPRERIIAASAVAIVALHSVGYAHSVPLMDYASRFAVHSEGWLLVIALVAAGAAVRAARRAWRRAPATGVSFACLMALALFVDTARGAARLPDEYLRTARYERSLRRGAASVAAWIETHTPRDATLATYPDAGLVPYRTGRTTIDFGRLNDRFLAGSQRTPDEVARYFFDLEPDVLVVSQPSPGHLWDSGAERIASDPRFEQGYRLDLAVPLDDRLALRVYARRR
jgi:hypothetical protein